MRRNKIQQADFKVISTELGIPVSEVERIVNSFFHVIDSNARRLPFDDARKIYTKERFEEFVSVCNIPYLGRLGPVYSRYLKWRQNESYERIQVPRSSYRSGFTQDEIEHIAGDILAGRTPSLKKNKKTDLYNQVWMVGKDGKKLARQVLPKEKKHGIHD